MYVIKEGENTGKRIIPRFKVEKKGDWDRHHRHNIKPKVYTKPIASIVIEEKK